MEEPKSPLRAPRPSRKRRINPVRCCFGIIIFLAVLATVAITSAIFIAAMTVIRNLRDPHKAVFVPTIPPSGNGTVRPLIGKDDTFDLVFGIWVREPLEKTGGVSHLEKVLALADNDEGNSTRGEVLLDERLETRHDRMIYEETIFRDVRMDSKVLDKSVHFDLPTDILQDRLLFAMDIRATLSVIPHTVDMETMRGYSDWRPANAGPYSRLSKEYKSSGNPLKWEALERVAISNHPMIFFDNGECLEKVKKVRWKMPDGHNNWAFPPSNTMTDQIAIDNALTAKPYFFTRAHFYVIQEVRNISEEVYEKHHQELRRSSCGQSLHPPNPSRWFCHRNYEKHGNWGTRIDLGTHDDPADLRYGPYLGVLKKAAGPKDLLQLPGIRPTCRNVSVPIEELPKTIPIEYHIRFSSLSPARVKVLDDIMPGHQINITATDRDNRIGHDNWELMNGLFGNKVHGTKPYTRLFLGTFSDIVFPTANIILSFLYWATRQTTAGISLLSIWSLILSISVDTGQLAVDACNTDDYSLMAFQAVFSCWMFAQLWYLLRLALPFDLVWNGLKISIERKEWTHRERASRRIDTGPWPVWIGVLGLLWLVQYLSATDRFHVISSVLTADPPTKYLEIATGSLVDALYATSMVLQLVHNHKSQTFAGTYHLVAAISLAETVSRMMYHVPAVVGRYEVGRGLGLDMVIRLGLELTRVWQGYKWSRVEQIVQEDDE